MRKDARAQRDAEIYEMREAGMTFDAIARRVGLGYERTRQIYHREDDRRRATVRAGHGQAD